MRASRLLRILLLLQNRGRLTAGALAEELEVARRTILRDVDALTEAGLPILVFPGQGGGIELCFDYRTRLTGLAKDEAEALGVMLAHPPIEMGDIGLADAGRRAAAKLREALPDRSRADVARGAGQFPASLPQGAELACRASPDPRRAALARAVRDRREVRLQAKSAAPRLVWPEALSFGPGGWNLEDGRSGDSIAESAWGDINISARRRPDAATRNGAG